jgi:hypothetical protein
VKLFDQRRGGFGAINIQGNDNRIIFHFSIVPAAF